MNNTVAERARAFFMPLSPPVFVLVMTVMTFVVTLPFYPVAKAVLSAGGELAGPTGIDKMPFWIRLFAAVIIIPPLETAISQSLPILLCIRLGMSLLGALLVSALLFGLLHSYGAFYVVLTFACGLVLSYTYYLAIQRKESPFWMVTAVHATRNAAALAIRVVL